MKKVLLLLLLAAAPSIRIGAAADTYLKLSLPNAVASGPAFIRIADLGSQVTVTDLKTGKTTQGSKAGDRVEWQFEGHKITAKKMPDESWIDGMFEIQQGLAMQIQVIKLNSVWACSNHQNPTHCASSEEEMRLQTAANHCEGWHKL